MATELNLSATQFIILVIVLTLALTGRIFNLKATITTKENNHDIQIIQ